ncbi:MAG: glycosyltransferase family 39 protein, partial [bacterium]
MTVAILLLALVLRLILFNQSLWLDESIEAFALMGKMGPILTYSLSDFQPPLYHFIGFLWTHFAGFSEIALRTPSLISGLLTVYFVIKLARLLFGKRVSVIAGVLAATNPLLIYYSQEGRTYAMTTMFVTASFYFLFRLLKQKNIRPSLILSYLLFTIGALWTSYLAWVVIALQALYLLYKKKYKIFSFTVLSFLTLIFWLPSLIQSLRIGLSTAGNTPEWGRVVGGMSLKALGLTWVKMVIGRISFANKYLYALIVAGLALLHSLALKRLRPLSKINSLLLFWLASIPAIAIIAIFIPVYSYFRLLFIVPAYLILLSVGLSKFPRPTPTFLVITTQIIFLAVFWFTPRFHREDWRSLTNYLNTQTGVVGMPSLAQNAPLLYYQLNLPLIEPKEGLDSSPETIYYVKYVEDLFDTKGQGR